MIEQNMGVTCKELFTAIKEYAEIVGVTIGTQKDETRRYACGPIPVDVTLPEGEHEETWGYPFEWEIELVSELAEYDDF